MAGSRELGCDAEEDGGLAGDLGGCAGGLGTADDDDFFPHPMACRLLGLANLSGGIFRVCKVVFKTEIVSCTLFLMGRTDTLLWCGFGTAL